MEENVNLMLENVLKIGRKNDSSMNYVVYRNRKWWFPSDVDVEISFFRNVTHFVLDTSSHSSPTITSCWFVFVFGNHALFSNSSDIDRISDF